MPLRVNGQEIGEERIREEIQYHPAASPDAARLAAENALVVRTLLLAEARVLGLQAKEPLHDPARRLMEAPEEALIRTLIEREVQAREPSEEECRSYYDSNPARFRSPELFQAAHILFAADPRDRAALAAAKQAACATLARLGEKPELFEDLARELSDCSSKANGGDLGQLTRGSTVPEFETFLLALEPGQICPVPVVTPYGVHIVRLDRRRDGRQLPYGAVRQRIVRFLRERLWQEAVRSYIGRLMAAASIERRDMDDKRDRSCGAGCACGQRTELPL